MSWDTLRNHFCQNIPDLREAVDGLVVDGDDHDLGGRVEVGAQLGAGVIGLELQALEEGSPQ